MQIVIDIPEEMYKWVNDINKIFDDYGIGDFIDLVKNGTPLPKGHGRLIDEKEVKKMIEETKVNSEHSKTFAENIIKFAPTIIEAESEDKE